jgi:hypothetical protein
MAANLNQLAVMQTSTARVPQAFEKHKRGGQWCYDNFLNRRALVRASEIRNQLEKYLKRFARLFIFKRLQRMRETLQTASSTARVE